MKFKRRHHLPAALILSGMVASCGRERQERDGGVVPAPGLARLELIRGAVSLERGSTHRPAALEPLFANDVVETGADGEAGLRFPDGRLVEMGANARLSIQLDHSQVVVSVVRGLILSRSSADAGEPVDSTVALNILTPFGLTRVGNTQHEVTVEIKTDGGSVDVLVGSVEFVAKTGETSRLAAGGKLVLGIGAPQVLEIKPQTKALTVLASRTQGEVEWHSVHRRGWEKLAIEPRRLTAGDVLRSRGGELELQLEGSRSRARGVAGTRVEFNGGRQVGSTRELRLGLLEGSLGLAAAEGEKLRVLVDDAELEASGCAYARLTKRNHVLTIEAMAGDLFLSRRAEKIVLKAGRVARLEGDTLLEGAIASSPLQLPSAKGLKVFHPALSEATLTWPAKSEDFFVQVSSDPRFLFQTFEGLVHQARVRIPIPARGPLFWRVWDPLRRAVQYQGDALFRPEALGSDLAELRHEVPDGVEQTTLYYQDRPPALTFTFASYSGAVAHRLAVYRRDDLENPAVERTLSGNSVSLRSGMLGDGAYVWSATPLGENGEALVGGRMNRLEITYDNSVPTLAVKSPKNGEAVKPTGMLASGVAPVGSQVLIDGQAIALDRFHRFSVRVTPSGHPPVVVFQLATPSTPPVFIARALTEPF